MARLVITPVAYMTQSNIRRPQCQWRRRVFNITWISSGLRKWMRQAVTTWNHFVNLYNEDKHAKLCRNKWFKFPEEAAVDDMSC